MFDIVFHPYQVILFHFTKINYLVGSVDMTNLSDSCRVLLQYIDPINAVN